METVLFPHPLKKPSLLGAVGGFIFGGSCTVLHVMMFVSAGELGLGLWPTPPGEGVVPPSSFRNASSLPLTSFSSCLATASAVLALTKFKEVHFDPLACDLQLTTR